MKCDQGRFCVLVIPAPAEIQSRRGFSGSALSMVWPVLAGGLRGRMIVHCVSLMSPGYTFSLIWNPLSPSAYSATLYWTHCGSPDGTIVGGIPEGENKQALQNGWQSRGITSVTYDADVCQVGNAFYGITARL